MTAFVAQGRYAESELIDFGFAHNTPSNKRKVKLGLDAVADGGIPWLYQAWSGRTADQATVEENMEKLASWLRKHGRPLQETLVVGDRAMLDAEIALSYDAKGLHHLTGLRALTTESKALISGWSDEQIEAYPIMDGPSLAYWGRTVSVILSHEGQTATHKGLVVMAGPLRDQLRESRQLWLDALEQQLEQLRTKIGEPRLRSVKAVQRRVNARLHESKAAHFMEVTVYATSTGQINLFWRRNHEALVQAERCDGRYLLVTNDWSLSPHEMFRLYRQKDGVEKCFHICKSDLTVSPLYLHQDERISSMIFINMVALLAYNLLQRQMQKQGLPMTTRHLIQRLQPLTIIETHCWDGSSLRRLTPVDPDLIDLLHLVAAALDDLVQTALPLDQPHRLLDTAHLGPAALLC